jgi:hypothetical protein
MQNRYSKNRWQSFILLAICAANIVLADVETNEGSKTHTNSTIGIKDPSATLGLQDIPDGGMRAEYVKNLYTHFYEDDFASRVYVKKPLKPLPEAQISTGYLVEGDKKELFYVLFISPYMDELTDVERDFVLLHEAEHIVLGHNTGTAHTPQQELDADWGAMERMGTNEGAIRYFSRPEINEWYDMMTDEEKKADHHPSPKESLAAAQKFQPRSTEVSGS